MGDDIRDLRQLFFRKATPTFAWRCPLRETVQQGPNVLEAKAQFTGGVDDLKPINHAGIISAPATNAWRRRHQPHVLVITDGRGLNSNLARQFANVETTHTSRLLKNEQIVI